MTKPFDISITEIEHKYKADSVTLSQFNEFAQSIMPVKYLEAASWDIYYSPPKQTQLTTNVSLPFDFLRFRDGQRPELTTKVQLNEKNNQKRIEIDLPLDPSKPKHELRHMVHSFCTQMGFVENFKIFKYCSIFFYEKLDIVYYTVYNENLEEKGRFIEIEARKDASFSSEEEAIKVVLEMEQKLSILGISPQNRIKKSQWQMWRKW